MPVVQRGRVLAVLMGLLLICLGARTLFSLNFQAFDTVIAILEFGAGIFWFWSLMP